VKTFIPKVVLGGFLAAICISCGDRQAASKRVTNALNPPKVLVTNGEGAVLKLKAGYAFVRLQTTKTNFHFTVWHSDTPTFLQNSNPLIEGDSASMKSLAVAEAKIWIGDGTETATYVQLDYGDYTTGLALVKTADPFKADFSNQAFGLAQRVNPADLQKAIGVK